MINVIHIWISVWIIQAAEKYSAAVYYNHPGRDTPPSDCGGRLRHVRQDRRRNHSLQGDSFWMI